MNPKEKAKKLVEKFTPYCDVHVYPKSYNCSEFLHIPLVENAKKCALICVEEIISIGTQAHYIDYWEEVKREIEKI